MDIFLTIMVFLLGGCIGGMITLRVLEKSMNKLIDSYDNLVKTQTDIMDIDNKIIDSQEQLIDIKIKFIELYKGVIQTSYQRLVDLRDGGAEDLDEVIGYLGEALDDHKED